LREAVIIALLAFVLFLPFHLTFRAPVGGATPWLDLPLLNRLTSIIGIYLGERSGWHAFIIIFGLMALPIIAGSYLYRSTTVVDNTGVAISEMPRWVEWLPFILLCIGLLIGFPLLALAGLAVYTGWRALTTDEAGVRCGMLIAALGSSVLFGVEIIYIRDVFEGLAAVGRSGAGCPLVGLGIGVWPATSAGRIGECVHRPVADRSQCVPVDCGARHRARADDRPEWLHAA